MKKIFLIIIVLIILLISISDSDVKEEKRGVFVSYIELSNYIKSNSVSESKKNIDLMINNIKNMRFNMIVLQVRSFSDSIYKSEIFPWSSCISSKEGIESFDVLDYFLEKSHEENILVYAWINPYRVRTNNDISTISKENPAYKYIGSDTLYVNNGIYYNPSKKDVKKLIVNGIEELIDNYEVDGILFDDYFYPSDDIDINDYNEYVKENGSISLSDYHLMIINDMVEDVYKVCKEKGILFGISPDGNIDNNYNKNYADVKKWMSSDKYIDFIMPQIYYGFYNESRDFYSVLNEWEKLLKNKNIEMMIALAFYKVGMEDIYARGGKLEWVNNDNIIMREVMLSRNINNYNGFSLFRYGYLFDNNLYSVNTLNEIKNINKIVN